MAKVLRSQFEREQVSAADFLRYSAVLSTLTEEEIVFLSTLCRHYRQGAGQDLTRVYRGVVEELAGGVERTGLINPITSIVGGAGYQVEPAPQLWKLVELASLEEALQAEDARAA
jgi:hypothetical protein